MSIQDRNVIKKFVPFADFSPGNNKVVTPEGIDATAEWKLLFARVRFASTATGGPRLLQISLANEQGQLIYQMSGRATIPPNANVLHALIPGSRRDSGGSIPASFTDFMELSIPQDLVVHRGHTLRIRDDRNRDPLDIMNISGMIGVLR